MKLKIYITILIAGVVAYAASSSRQKAFAPADDFPRDALIYVQTGDLPAFVKLWDESKLKEKYTASENFAELQNRHLALKLVSRWHEFSDAAGFPIDLETLQTSSQTGAAIAVYDIGKLEFVFIAPVSDEVFAATKFVRNQEKFQEETLGDGTTIYSVAVEADRGRQKQKLLFAHAGGRFVLATSEKLLLRTLSNINGKSSKDRLSDETSFKALSEKTEPHAATVWINQIALNADYYFKHYWLMDNSDELKNIRAGMFDLAIEEGKFVEHRIFLTDESAVSQKISPAEANRILNYAPADVPFYRVQAATAKISGEAIYKTILDRRTKTAESEKTFYARYRNDDFEDFGERSYGSLSDEFDETIDEADEEEIGGANLEADDESPFDLQTVLQAAKPQSVLSLTRPQKLPMPLFAEFRRAVVINLASSGNFNQSKFESAITRSVMNRVTISDARSELEWKTETENGAARREIQLPMLGWEIGYALRGNELIVSNSSDFLRELAANQIKEANEKPEAQFNELTVVNLERREEAYDEIFAELKDAKADGDFFLGNIASLLDTFSDVRKIEIKTTREPKFFSEEVTMYLR